MIYDLDTQGMVHEPVALASARSLGEMQTLRLHPRSPESVCILAKSLMIFVHIKVGKVLLKT